MLAIPRRAPRRLRGRTLAQNAPAEARSRAMRRGSAGPSTPGSPTPGPPWSGPSSPAPPSSAEPPAAGPPAAIDAVATPPAGGCPGRDPDVSAGSAVGVSVLAPVESVDPSVAPGSGTLPEAITSRPSGAGPGSGTSLTARPG